MNEKLRELLEQTRAALRWVDDQPERQRLLLLVAAFCILFILWDAVLMSSAKNRDERGKADIEMLEKQVEALELEAEALVKRLAADPNVERRRRKAELERRIANMDLDLSTQTADLIPPAEMVRVLKELLGRDTTLTLIRLESLAAEPLIAASEEEDERESGTIPIYKHGLVIELMGDYLSAMRYLQAVEALPWNFLWDSFEYVVQEYPRGRLVLKVLSLSTEESWIGV
jgi:MSHA biogenesis protein MshJ